MTTSHAPGPKILSLRLALNNYPILAEKIREQMREELFARGIIDPDVLGQEAERKAIESQKLEGLTNPYYQESEELWTRRVACIQDYLTDFYFAYNLPFNRFEEIVNAAINENRTGRPENIPLTFNPELAPWDMLFAQAEKYANYPPELFETVKHHQRGMVVVLLKGMVSDHLAFVRIARKFINIFDLRKIRDHRIGRGKIGGKAAGMILAYNILNRPDPEDEIDFGNCIALPETHFIGSDVYYNFQAINNFERFVSQKYLTREEIEREYPRIRRAYLAGRFPRDITKKLEGLLAQIGQAPIIVRSSSLLEDNFGSAFAGKYESVFLPNQGSQEENLTALLDAIKQVYSSILSPDALFYRQIQGLDDYDERMAILIQKVQGQTQGKYFFPFIGGVGFSRNPFIWNKKLRPEDGFLRIVLGLGTRAVDRVARDYPRMIGLSHPQLRPVKGTAEIIKYAQRLIDAIDLQANTLESVPVSDVLSDDFPGLQHIASIDEGDFVKPIFSLGTTIVPENLVLTFDGLLKNTDFVKIMKNILKKLERHYERPVDIEFTVELCPDYPKPNFKIYLLQCRPLSNREWMADVTVPRDVPNQDQIFTSNRLVPQGVVDKIKYIVYVDPIEYSRIPSNTVRLELARIIGRLNKKLEGETFILMGPGRWGSSNIDLGVKVSYADIYNTRMLV
ncbi:MAG: PEP/pyruvate-binding domain-containing protein, partial [Anaerolineae bacterium]|nr:PEP/pyruvate-binding domain-containing protein [Anaerolineae bacterium]